MSQPTLIVVSGPPGSGKTSLAHALARAIPCPAICRDDIKEGMVHAAGPEFQAGPGDPLTQRTLPLFFDILRTLVSAGVTVVAEAAFQDQRWRDGLEPFLDRAELRIAHCRVDPAVSFARATNRASAHTKAHGDSTIGKNLEDWKRVFESFEPISIPAPSIEVDTTDGYTPDLAEVVGFVNGVEAR
jgi:predicted kinase